MNASIKLLQSVLPTSVGLRVKIPSAHPSAQILGTDRMGTGTLIDPSGIVLTVNYVALGADTIEVTLLDETRLDGHVIAQDFFSGLAAIKIPGEGYPAARAVGADSLRTGQEVFIVASAGGSQRRVNSGAISSLDPFDAFWEFHLERGILTTAMNPGLGGGGLFTNLGRARRRRVARSQRGRPLHARHPRLTTSSPTARSCCATANGSRARRAPGSASTATCCANTSSSPASCRAPRASAPACAPATSCSPSTTSPSACAGDLYHRLWEHKPGETIRFHVFRDNAVVEVEVQGADVEQFFA